MSLSMTSNRHPYILEKKKLAKELKVQGISPEIIDVMIQEVRREDFIPRQPDGTYHPKSYGNHPLSIGYRQTISQPFIVAYMIMLLRINPYQKKNVLEIGTGLGYNAAVMSRLAPRSHIYSIEIEKNLCRKAMRFFNKYRKSYPNVSVRCGDGFLGWKPFDPKLRFDRIIITASTQTHQLQNLLKQLRPRGKLVVPLEKKEHTYLYVFQKHTDGRITRRRDIGVRFVPFTGQSRYD